MARSSFLLLLLLAAPAWAQPPGAVHAYPSPGKVVGLVTSDVEGEWGVIAQDFVTVVQPSVEVGGKLCWFEAVPGKYLAIQSGGAGQLRMVPVDLSGVTPGPGPTPPGPTPPGPKPPDPPSPAPWQELGLRAMVVYEASPPGSVPEPELQVLYSSAVREYLHLNVAKEGLIPAYRFWDDDFTDAEMQAAGISTSWRKAYRDVVTMKPKDAAWIAVGNGTSGYVGPLPKTVDDTLILLRKYGGN